MTVHTLLRRNAAGTTRAAAALLLSVAVTATACSEPGAVAPEPSADGPSRSTISSTIEAWGVDSGRDAVTRWDADAGRLLETLGPLGPDFIAPISLATEPGTGRILVWDNGERVLLQVDPATGAGTPLGPSQGELIGGLAYGPEGTLFGTSFQLFQLDPQTAAVTVVGNLGLRVAGLSFSPDGVLYGLELAGGAAGSVPERLVRIDPATAAVEVVGTTSQDIGIVGDIMFTADGRLRGTGRGGSLGNVFYDLDPETAQVSNVRTASAGPPQGLGLVDPFEVPPPVVVLDVEIDVKPGSDPNSIECNRPQAVISVAILSTRTSAGEPLDFDATDVDHATVTFEGASEVHVNRGTGEPLRHEEDVDGDGDVDLVLHFELGDTDLTCSSTEGTLQGETFDGTLITGSDAVRMVGR